VRHHAEAGRPSIAQARGLFGKLQPLARSSDHAYLGVVGRVIGRRALHLGVFAAIVVAMALLFVRLPTGFLPDEDQGMAMVCLAARRRHGGAHQSVIDQIQKHYLTERRSWWPAMVGQRLQLQRSGAECGHGLCRACAV
jgi:multidrug efflux pump